MKPDEEKSQQQATISSELSNSRFCCSLIQISISTRSKILFTVSNISHVIVFFFSVCHVLIYRNLRDSNLNVGRQRNQGMCHMCCEWLVEVWSLFQRWNDLEQRWWARDSCWIHITKGTFELSFCQINVMYTALWEIEIEQNYTDTMHSFREHLCLLEWKCTWLWQFLKRTSQHFSTYYYLSHITGIHKNA